jgi:rSAM/selenodomain-associated transferase 1
MAKVPRAGNVKTRLQPFLSAEQCRTLAEAFLYDTINKTRNVCEELVIAFAPAHEKNYFADFDCKNLTLIEQNGEDLGEKMFNAFKFVLSVSTDTNVLIIGTDSPTFSVEFIERAFEALESNSETVLGKSEDGGFYLIGLR